MNNMENENTQHASRHLNQLFEAFMDADAANQAARDIETGDKLLNSFPAPSPSHEAIERIKADVSRALNRKRIVSIQWKVLSAVGAAAIISDRARVKYSTCPGRRRSSCHYGVEKRNTGG